MMKSDKQKEREIMIEWCALISGVNVQFYRNMTDEKLMLEYTKLMTDVSTEMQKEQ